jgi:hypothetical protein
VNVHAAAQPVVTRVSFRRRHTAPGRSCIGRDVGASYRCACDPARDQRQPTDVPLKPVAAIFTVHLEETMSIFSKIISAILGTRADAAPAANPAAGPIAGGTAPAGSAGAVGSGGSPTAAPAQPVDVAAILDKAAAAKKAEKLEWRTSIVDLMKALDIDSSLGARKELAKELNYTGDTNDSASMNVWLHKQVMAKLAANGGKLPPDIKH